MLKTNMNKKGDVTISKTILIVLGLVVLTALIIMFLTFTNPGKKLTKDMMDKLFVLPPGLSESEMTTPESESEKAIEQYLEKSEKELSSFIELKSEVDKIISDSLAGKFDKNEAIFRLESYLGTKYDRWLHEKIGDFAFVYADNEKHWKKAIYYHSLALEDYKKRKDELKEEELKQMYFIYTKRAISYLKSRNLYYAHLDYKIVEKSNYGSFKKLVEDYFKPINCYWNYSRLAYDRILESRRKDDPTLLTASLILFMDSIIDKENVGDNYLCVDDARNQVSALCFERSILDKGGKERCSYADTQPKKYYPKT